MLLVAAASSLSTTARRRMLRRSLSEATTQERLEAFVEGDSMLDLLLGIDARPARALAKRIERHAKSLGVAVRVDVVGLGDEAALADLVELGIRDPTNPRGEVLVSYGFDDDDVACTCAEEWFGGGDENAELARAACPKCSEDAAVPASPGMSN